MNYTITDGTAINGVTYSANPTGTLTFAPGVTEQTIFVNTIPLGINNNLLVPSINFTVSLNNASLDVPPSAASAGSRRHDRQRPSHRLDRRDKRCQREYRCDNRAGARGAVPSASYSAGYCRGRRHVDSPDGHHSRRSTPFIVIMTNGQYTVYDETTGFLQTQTSLDQFWTNAGIAATSLTGDAVNPRVIFDPFFQRFFAVAINPVGRGKQQHSVRCLEDARSDRRQCVESPSLCRSIRPRKS